MKEKLVVRAWSLHQLALAIAHYTMKGWTMGTMNDTVPQKIGNFYRVGFVKELKAKEVIALSHKASYYDNEVLTVEVQMENDVENIIWPVDMEEVSLTEPDIVLVTGGPGGMADNPAARIVLTQEQVKRGPGRPPKQQEN